MDASYLSFLCTNDFRCVLRYYYGVNVNTEFNAMYTLMKCRILWHFIRVFFLCLRMHLGVISINGLRLCTEDFLSCDFKGDRIHSKPGYSLFLYLSHSIWIAFSCSKVANLES